MCIARSSTVELFSPSINLVCNETVEQQEECVSLVEVQLEEVSMEMEVEPTKMELLMIEEEEENQNPLLVPNYANNIINYYRQRERLVKFVILVFVSLL